MCPAGKKNIAPSFSQPVPQLWSGELYPRKIGTGSDSFLSYGSHNLTYKYKLILFQAGKMKLKLTNLFAPCFITSYFNAKAD